MATYHHVSRPARSSPSPGLIGLTRRFRNCCAAVSGLRRPISNCPYLLRYRRTYWSGIDVDVRTIGGCDEETDPRCDVQATGRAHTRHLPPSMLPITSSGRLVAEQEPSSFAPSLSSATDASGNSVISAHRRARQLHRRHWCAFRTQIPFLGEVLAERSSRSR